MIVWILLIRQHYGTVLLMFSKRLHCEILCDWEGDGIRFNVIKSCFQITHISVFSFSFSFTLHSQCWTLRMAFINCVNKSNVRSLRLFFIWSLATYVHILQYIHMWQSFICLWTELSCPIKKKSNLFCFVRSFYLPLSRTLPPLSLSLFQW